jgi:hypothetical protein
MNKLFVVSELVLPIHHEKYVENVTKFYLTEVMSRPYKSLQFMDTPKPINRSDLYGRGHNLF